MKKISPVFLSFLFVTAWGLCTAQCTIDTTNTNIGFTPGTPAVVRPGVAYQQTAQVFVPATYTAQSFTYIVDSLHIDSITGMPTGITYILNPSAGTVLGGTNGVICYSGTTNDIVGPYPLTFYGDIFTNGGEIPFSYLVQLAPSFGYKFRVETTPVAAFVADSPVCTSVDSVRFTDLTGGYPTGWAWTFAGGIPATSTKQFPVVHYDSSGTFAVTLIARNSIAHDTLTQYVTVNPSVTGSATALLPAMGADSAANGSATVVPVGGTPPFTYLWSNGATTDTVTNAIAGLNSVTATDSKGCQYVNDSVVIGFISGIVELSAGEHVKIYPNPTADVLNLDWSQKSNAEVSIVDLNGSVLRTFISTGEMKSVYDIHSLAEGDYILRITDKATNEQRSMLFAKF